MPAQGKAHRSGRRAAIPFIQAVARLARQHLFPLLSFYGAVWLAHWPLLRLPYYWDEAGYYIPAAYDFFRRGAIIPYSTLTNAHPPLPSLYLSAWWWLFGFSPLVTRTAMCLVATVALAAVYCLAQRVTGERRAALATVLLTALYPVWFVQSTLAHADLLAAAGTLWGLSLLDGWGAERQESSPVFSREHGRQSAVVPSHRLFAAVCCFVSAALAKETAVGTSLALAAWELWLATRTRAASAGSTPVPAEGSAEGEAKGEAVTMAGPDTGHLQAALALTLPALSLAAWFGFHRWRTGFFFGNPEYLRYNATETLTPLRIALALAHRALHLTAHLNLFVPVLVTLGCLLLPRLLPKRAGERPRRARLLVVIVANWVFFSALGGALLTRYLLPVYPLVLLLCVATWRERLRQWGWLVALSAAAFVLGLFFNPPYRFAPEDTLAYRDSILLQQHAIAQIQARYGHPTVLTAWPATDALTKPELGYVVLPFPVVAIDNFSYEQIKVAAEKSTENITGSPQAGPAGKPGQDQFEESQPYSVALLFSTKYDPPGLLLQLQGQAGWRNRALDERFFAFHQDLPPETIARLLGGEIVWREARSGQWAAVLHFNRPQLARIAAPQAAASLRQSLPVRPQRLAGTATIIESR